MRVRSIVSLVFGSLAMAVVSAQAPQNPPPPSQPTPTFRTGTRLVVYNVTVKDRDGKPVEGLTAKDFIIKENNVVQEVAFVGFQRLADDHPAKPTPDLTLVPAAPLDAAARAEASRITVPPRNDTRYQDRRLLTMYFDLSRMSQADQLRAFDAAMTFVRGQMSRSDLVAIMALQSGAVRIRQDFTDDRPRLLEVLSTMMAGDDIDQDGTPDLDVFGSDFGQNAGEFNIFNTDRRMAALHTAINALRPIAQQKVLMYFGSGLSGSGADNAAQYQSTVNAALKANVAISTIDTRGLVALSPVANASRQSPGGMSMFTGAAAVNTMSGFLASQDTLYALAKDTGGKALLDYNDLSVGIVDAARLLTSYYMVAYESTNATADGRFRRVTVELANGQKYDVSSRPGYYADKSWANYSASDRERQLEDAFMLEDPLTEMTLAVELNFFKLNRAEYFVPVSVKIPGSELAIARRRGAARTEIDFMSEVKDNNKITYSNVRERLEIRLTEDVVTQLATRPIQYQTGFTLLPGSYVIKMLARDTVTGRIGTFQAKFAIPNLEKDDGAVPISSVVLSAQREPVGTELFAIKNAATQAVDPLIHDGLRLIPSVTRVFRADRDLFVYLQTYQPGATEMRPLTVVVGLYRGAEKVYESAPMAVSSGMDARSKAVPLRLSVPAATLPPGEYECQITVLDPTSQKAAFWRGPLTVVQ
jgi:VWFA-related protein